MKPQILILHGAMGSASQFQQFQQQLGFPTLAMDFIGHGQEPDGDSPWSIQLFADQLERYIESMPEPLSIFGYSMGGYVALWLSLRRPDLVPRLLTLGTKLDWQQADVDKAAEKMSHAKTLELMQGLASTPLLTPEVMSTVTIPVRYCVGDRDSMVRIDETQRFYRATPNAEFAVLPNTRHPFERVPLHEISWHVSQFLVTATP